MSERADHWDDIYSSAPSAKRSWYEREPSHSLRLIDMNATDPSVAVVDIGSGTSVLADHLLERGFTDVTLLDISEHALGEVRGRLGERANRVSLIRHDVLSWQPDRQYGIWHDRAVFHFLTEPSQRARYISLAEASVRDDGVLIVATFAEDGPTECSGLPVQRYSAAELRESFARCFELVHRGREAHATPWGAVQPFTWVVLRRRAR